MNTLLGISLPSSWTSSRLKRVTSRLNRGSAPTYVDDGPVRAISQAANQEYGLDWGRTQFHNFDGDPTKLKGHLQPHDIIVNSTGTGTLGRVGYFQTPPDNTPCMADSHITVVRTRSDELHPRFAYYWLKSQPFQEYVYAALVVGATNQIELNRDRLADAPIPVPSVQEQYRIAKFLEAETARIHNLTLVKERALTLLHERRIAVISDACIRGIRSNCEMKSSGIGPLGVIPAHWNVVRNKTFLGEIVELSEDGSEELLTVSHITGVTPRSDKNVYMFMAESTVGYKVCQPGDLVINTLWAWMGALGVSQHKGIVSPAYGVYRFRLRDAMPEYFDYLYRTPAYVCEMTRYSKGVWTSRLRLYPESFLALHAPVPPRREQDQIVKAIECELEPAMRLQNAIQRSITLLAEHRQALITAAVTGQFDVSSASGRGVVE